MDASVFLNGLFLSYGWVGRHLRTFFQTPQRVLRSMRLQAKTGKKLSLTPLHRLIALVSTCLWGFSVILCKLFTANVFGDPSELRSFL